MAVYMEVIWAHVGHHTVLWQECIGIDNKSKTIIKTASQLAPNVSSSLRLELSILCGGLGIFVYNDTAR